jgi:hypothetical protein
MINQYIIAIKCSIKIAYSFLDYKILIYHILELMKALPMIHKENYLAYQFYKETLYHPLKYIIL